jgi:hypothetical protein
MKKIILNIKRLMPAFLMALAFTSCLKDKGYDDGLYGAVRNTEGGMYVSMRAGGLSDITKSNVPIDASSPLNDTVDLYIDLDYYTKTNKDVTVKIAFDDAKRVAYNTANSKNYLPVTAAMVKLLSTTITIPAGERVGHTQLVIKQDLFDGSVSYMFPVTITDGGGLPLSSNLNTKYFNIIGNPLAGAYLMNFSRWNGTTDTTTAANGGGFVNEPINILPETGTVLLLPEDYLQTFVGGYAGISLSFDNNNGVFSNFSVSLNKKTTDGLAAGGFTIATAPKLAGYQIVGDASTKYAGSWFRTYMVLINSSGGVRTVIDHFVKQ